MFDRNSPIGVLDSGIGGFSVARQVQRLLPGEDLLYFGDGANVPYGNHSADEIVAMSRYMFQFMEERGVKALLVACNTISCVSDLCEDVVSCPVFNAVQAGADAAVETAHRLGIKKIGVISTVFTHSTNCYPEHIAALDPELTVCGHGCPDLAQLVERHLCDPDGMSHVDANLREELDGLVGREGIHACVLGCTHYSLVEENIRRLYPSLPLIDPAEQMALKLRACLAERDLLRQAENGGRLDVYTTSDVAEYESRAKQAGLDPVSSVSLYPAMSL